MPSRRPSAPSQAASRPSTTAFRSASENARRPSGFPDASSGATRFSIVATHSSPMPENVRAHRRRADDDAVEVGRIALGHQHALAPAGRAAHEVRVGGGPAVVLRDDLLREHGHAPDRLVGEVEARLLLRHEGRVEDLPAVTGVGGDDGEAAGERGLAPPRPAERRRHRAVQAAPALEEEPSVPLGGKGQREADAVAPAVRAGAPVERRAQPAVGGQRHGERRHPRRLLRRGRAGREPLGRHLRQRGARHLQLPEGRARGLAGRDLRQRSPRRKRSHECDDRSRTRGREAHVTSDAAATKPADDRHRRGSAGPTKPCANSSLPMGCVSTPLGGGGARASSTVAAGSRGSRGWRGRSG